MKLRWFLLFACIYAWFGRDGARGQSSQPVSTPQPNCIISAQFTAAGNSKVLDNRAVGCLNFALTVSVPTTVSALSIVLQTAQDNGSSNCSTCTWATYTAATGSNPSTSTAGENSTYTTAAGGTYFDYLRVQLTSVTGTGTVYAKLGGAVSGVAGGSGGGGGGGSGCVGTTMTPCVVVGTKTNNNAAPGANNVGALVGLANAAAPTNTEGDEVLLSVDLAGNLRTTGTGTFTPVSSTAALSGQQAVTGTAVALASNALTNGVCVKALVGNTINVYVGPSGVTTANGLELAPGDAFCYQYSNTNEVFVIASTTGASVSWGAGH